MVAAPTRQEEGSASVALRLQSSGAPTSARRSLVMAYHIGE